MMSGHMRDPLLLVHGFTDTPRTWDSLIPRLRPHHEILAPALVGHSGGDPHIGDQHPLAALVAGLERAMDDAGWETAHLVGNSLGGWLALELASRGRARSVVALAPGGGWVHGSRPAQKTIRTFERNRRILPLGVRHADRLAARPRLRALALREMVARPQGIPPATAAALIRGAADCAIYDDWTEAVREGTYRSDLGPISVPVRIAWGSKDRILPKATHSGHFHEAVPGAEWVDLPGLGHLPQHDDPDLVARVVLEVTQGQREPAGAGSLRA